MLLEENDGTIFEKRSAGRVQLRINEEAIRGPVGPLQVVEFRRGRAEGKKGNMLTGGRKYVLLRKNESYPAGDHDSDH